MQLENDIGVDGVTRQHQTHLRELRALHQLVFDHRRFDEQSFRANEDLSLGNSRRGALSGRRIGQLLSARVEWLEAECCDQQSHQERDMNSSTNEPLERFLHSFTSSSNPRLNFCTTLQKLLRP